MELAKHPEYQELARQDVNNAIEKYGWTYEAFKEMKYLEQAILESLRLHPPVSTIDRYTREDYKVNLKFNRKVFRKISVLILEYLTRNI